MKFGQIQEKTILAQAMAVFGLFFGVSDQNKHTTPMEEFDKAVHSIDSSLTAEQQWEVLGPILDGHHHN